jgi:hypothetical protein
MNWYEFMAERQTCDTCGWSGPGSESVCRESFAEGEERACPKCGLGYFGFYAYPLISDSLTDSRAPDDDRLFAEVVQLGVARLKADEAIAKAARP